MRSRTPFGSQNSGKFPMTFSITDISCLDVFMLNETRKLCSNLV